MHDQLLLNPVWHALRGPQRDFAQRHDTLMRFPASVAPFVALRSADSVNPETLLDAVAPGETVDFVGVAPTLDTDWTCAEPEPIAQMHCEQRLIVNTRADIVELDASLVPQMLKLTGLVYPGYFRVRTHELGRYLGIFDHGELVAMAGERMRLGPWVEISAVCTHPEHLGRGYAQALVANLVNAILAGGARPFLHVSTQNARAISVYQRLRFERRGVINVWLAQRKLPG